MDVLIMVMFAIMAPICLFSLGTLLQVLIAKKIDSDISVPAAVFVLFLVGCLNYFCGFFPLASYLIILFTVVPLGVYTLIRNRMVFPWKEAIYYTSVVLAGVVFLGAARYFCFAGDWVVHGIEVPMKLAAHETVSSLRTYALSLLYSDFYTVFSPDYTKFYLVQILSICMNASILFPFLKMTGKRLPPAVSITAFFCCPFIMYEIALTWPKLFAVTVCFQSLRYLYLDEKPLGARVAGVVAAIFAVSVHPMSLFIILTVPFVMECPWRLKRSFLLKYCLTGILVLIMPKIIMASVGVVVTSASAYYPFFETWEAATDACSRQLPLAVVVNDYFLRVGVVGAVVSRVKSIITMVMPMRGVSVFAFYQTLLFALGPAGFTFGFLHVFLPSALGDHGSTIRRLLFAGLPIAFGVIFSVGYMLLQVAGGQWTVVVLAGYAALEMAQMDRARMKVLVTVSIIWNSLFIVLTVFAVHIRANDWIQYFDASLDGLLSSLPGFSHSTIVSVGDNIDYRISMCILTFAGLVSAFVALRKIDGIDSRESALE